MHMTTYALLYNRKTKEEFSIKSDEYASPLHYRVALQENLKSEFLLLHVGNEKDKATYELTNGTFYSYKVFLDLFSKGDTSLLNINKMKEVKDIIGSMYL